VVAVRGATDASGIFFVQEMCYPGMPDQVPRPVIEVSHPCFCMRMFSSMDVRKPSAQACLSRCPGKCPGGVRYLSLRKSF